MNEMAVPKDVDKLLDEIRQLQVESVMFNGLMEPNFEKTSKKQAAAKCKEWSANHQPMLDAIRSLYAEKTEAIKHAQLLHHEREELKARVAELEKTQQAYKGAFEYAVERGWERTDADNE